MPNYITCKICNVHFLNIQIKRWLHRLLQKYMTTMFF
jgi:hypothetical protein